MPKPSKREQLVEATKELLWEIGFEAMSPRDIQTRSAARPGSLYHHFPSKLALAGEAMGELAEADIKRVNEIFETDAPPMHTLESYLLAKRDAIRGCRFGRLAYEASIQHEELREPVAALFDAVRTNLAATLTRAQADGTLRPNVDPNKLAVTLLATVQGASVLARSYQDESIARQAMEGALSLLREASRAD